MIFFDEHIIEVLDENLVVQSGVYVSSNQGKYQIKEALPPGKYYIKTGSRNSNYSNRNYVNQVYPNIDCEGNICDFSKAELFEITSTEIIENIDFNLNRGLSISGFVKNSLDNQGLRNIEVVVLNQDGDFVDVIRTNWDGSYIVRGLKSGQYYLRTYNGNKKHYLFNRKPSDTPFSWVNQLYPDQNCVNDSCDLSSNNLIQINDMDVVDINFELEKGYAMSGFVRNRSNNSVVFDIEIKLYSELNEYIESYYTDERGYFATAALAVGNYKISTDNNSFYINQMTGGADCGFGVCDLADSTLVSITDGSINNINFDLIPGKDYYSQLSGLWYNQQQSGHGLQIEVIKSNGTATLYASWYVVKDGVPMWLTGTGPLNKELAFIDLYITNGNDFPPNFEPVDVQRSFWGTLNLNFTDRDHALMEWNTNAEGFSSGGIELQRLTNLSTTQKSDDSIDACLSGTYYNPDQSGHGVMLEVLGENADSMAITWFTYNDNKQFWLLATGAVSGTQANLSAIYTNGSDFPPMFDSEINETVEWGSFNLSKVDNDNIQLDWNPNSEHADFGSGSINLQRLTKIESLGCD